MAATFSLSTVRPQSPSMHFYWHQHVGCSTIQSVRSNNQGGAEHGHLKVQVQWSNRTQKTDCSPSYGSSDPSSSSECGSPAVDTNTGTAASTTAPHAVAEAARGDVVLKVGHPTGSAVLASNNLVVLRSVVAARLCSPG